MSNLSNKVSLEGRLTKDVELVANTAAPTDKNNAHAKIRIAVYKGYKAADGTRPADYFTVSAFGKVAETIAQYFHKGEAIKIEATLSNFEIVDATAENGKRQILGINLVEFAFPLTQKSKEAAATSPAAGTMPAPQMQQAPQQMTMPQMQQTPQMPQMTMPQMQQTPMQQAPQQMAPAQMPQAPQMMQPDMGGFQMPDMNGFMVPDMDAAPNFR